MRRGTRWGVAIPPPYDRGHRVEALRLPAGRRATARPCAAVARQDRGPRMQLTKNFKLEEFIRSETAKKLGIANQPGEEEIARLGLLCANVLQPARDRWGPIQITSGFRCPALNAAVGGEPDSQHLLGEAGDGRPVAATAQELVTWIRRELEYDQVILYPDGRFHVSFTTRRENRRQALQRNPAGAARKYSLLGG